MTRARIAFPLLIALLAVALAGFGCQPAAYKIGENDINPVVRASLPSGGTLNWPITTFPANYNANTTIGATSDVEAIVAALMPTTFFFDASARPVLNRDYLTSASMTTSASGPPAGVTASASAPPASVTATASHQVVTYEIDPRAVWSDGTPITVTDFQAQWKALNGADPAFDAAPVAGYRLIGAITQGSNPREVVVTFSRPFADWQGLFSPLYPASLNGAAQTFNRGWITGTVVSAGPFVFKGFDAQAQTVTIVRNPTWWGPAAKLDSIVYHVLPADPSAQLDALNQGTVDFVGLQADVGQLHKGQAIKATTVRRTGSPGFRQLTFNGASPTLSDIRVRTAMALAIDRTRIAKELLGPLGVPDSVLSNHIFMPNQVGYRDNAGDVGSFNATKAGALLDQAGWGLSNGVRSRKGQPLEIRLVIPSDAAQAVQEGNLIKDMLKAVGIALTVQAVTPENFFPAYVAKGDFDLALFSWEGAVFPISSSVPIYQSPTTDPGGKINYHSNYARLGSAQIDQLFVQAISETDPSKISSLGNQIDALIWQEVHSLTLYQRPRLVVQKTTLANFGAFGFASPNYEDIGFAKP